MAVTNLYSNLPGHLVEFKDGGLQLTTKNVDTNSTKSILILGTATDGPIDEPVKIDQNTVSQVFGDEVDKDGYSNGTTLTKYAKQAFKNGFNDVRCMRVTGSQAYTTLSGKEINAYEKKVDTIASSVDSDNYVHFNDAYTYAVKNTDDGFLPGAPDSTNNIKFVHADGTSDNIGFGTFDGQISFAPFKSVTINAGYLKPQDIVEISYSPVTFAKKTSGVVSDLTVGNSADDHAYSTASLTLATATNATGDLEATLNADTGYQLFNDTSANTTSGMPSDISSDGVIAIKSGSTELTKATDYTAVINSTKDASVITIPAAQATTLGLSAGDTIDVTYVDVKYGATKVVNVSAPDIIFKPSDIELPADVLAKRNFTIDKVVVYDSADTSATPVELATTEYTFASPVVTIKPDTFDAHPEIKDGYQIRVVYEYEEAITSEIEIKVKSQWGGSQYKDATVEVTADADGNKLITFTTATSKGAKSFSYSSKYYRTFDDLINIMANDNANTNMFEIELIRGKGTDKVSLLEVTSAKTLSEGGEDGIDVTNDEMFEALSGERFQTVDIGSTVDGVLVTADMVGYLKKQGAYQILENYNVDYIYPAGIYADSVQTVNKNSDFQRELALVCAAITYRTKMTHGYIDVKPNSNTTLVGIEKYVNNLLAKHSNLYYMLDDEGNVYTDTDGKKMDIGWYTSCVVGPEPVMRSDKLGIYYGSPAIAYAALNANLEPQSAPTNKALKGVEGLKFKLSNKQLDALTGQRFVTFKLKNEGAAAASSTPYVVDGVTSGAPNCDYARIATVKVLTDVVDQIREVADPFLGEPNTLAQRNALSALISKRLGILTEAGEILSYDFEVSASLQEQLLGEATIALTIVPAIELRKLTTVVALRAAS